MTTGSRQTIQLEVGGQRLRLTAPSADPSHLERLAEMVNGRVEKMQGATRHPSSATLLALVSLDLADEFLAERARSQRSNEEGLHACEQRLREVQLECERRVAEAESRARDVEAAARLMALEVMAEIDRALALDDEHAAREQSVGETA